MSSRLRVFLVLTAVFAASVLVRWHFLNRPLAPHNEWLTSTVVRTLEIWEMEGGWRAYRFLPIMTYPGTANYHIDNQAGLEDRAGKQYYISYPPLAYIVPYLAIKGLGVHIDVLPIQVFSLALHYLTAWLVYLTATLLIRQRDDRYARLCGVIAALVYIFSPATLWLHSNVYMSETFVQPLFVLGVYLYLRVQLSQKTSAALFVGLGTVTLLMVYADWLGVLFAFAVFLHGVYRWRNPKMRWMMLVVAIAGALAIVITLAHYSQIAGVHALFDRSTSKFLERSGASDKWTSRLTIKDWIQVLSYYSEGYFPGTIIFVVVLGALSLIFRFTKSGEPRSNSLLKPAVYITVVPVILHHLILFNYTFHHSFSVLKSAVLLSLLATLFCDSVLDGFARVSSPRWRHVIPGSIVGFLLLASLLNIYSFLRTNERSASTRFRDCGWTIRKLAQPDEVVFAVVDDPTEPWPQLIWYSKRNIARWTDEKSAMQLMALNNVDKAFVFTLTPDLRITSVQRLTRQGDALVAQNPIGQGNER